MRRRGEKLEAELLEAAWEQLRAEGYAAFTFDAVALRAGTSKPVLYRRWPNREALLLAALRHQREAQPVEVPDTGSLRNDVIALLKSAGRLRTSMFALMSVQFGMFFAETGKTPADLRRLFIAGRPTSMEKVIARAVERGEIAAGLPERVITLPFDLFRHETMMTLAEVPDQVIVDIVDQVFLPLVLRSATTD